MAPHPHPIAQFDAFSSSRLPPSSTAAFNYNVTRTESPTSATTAAAEVRSSAHYREYAEVNLGHQRIAKKSDPTQCREGNIGVFRESPLEPSRLNQKRFSGYQHRKHLQQHQEDENGEYMFLKLETHKNIPDTCSMRTRFAAEVKEEPTQQNQPQQRACLSRISLKHDGEDNDGDEIDTIDEYEAEADRDSARHLVRIQTKQEELGTGQRHFSQSKECGKANAATSSCKNKLLNNSCIRALHADAATSSCTSSLPRRKQLSGAQKRKRKRELLAKSQVEHASLLSFLSTTVTSELIMHSWQALQKQLKQEAAYFQHISSAAWGLARNRSALSSISSVACTAKEIAASMGNTENRGGEIDQFRSGCSGIQVREQQQLPPPESNVSVQGTMNNYNKTSGDCGSDMVSIDETPHVTMVPSDEHSTRVSGIDRNVSYHRSSSRDRARTQERLRIGFSDAYYSFLGTAVQPGTRIEDSSPYCDEDAVPPKHQIMRLRPLPGCALEEARNSARRINPQLSSTPISNKTMNSQCSFNLPSRQTSARHETAEDNLHAHLLLTRSGIRNSGIVIESEGSYVEKESENKLAAESTALPGIFGEHPAVSNNSLVSTCERILQQQQLPIVSSSLAKSTTASISDDLRVAKVSETSIFLHKQDERREELLHRKERQPHNGCYGGTEFRHYEAGDAGSWRRTCVSSGEDETSTASSSPSLQLVQSAAVVPWRAEEQLSALSPASCSTQTAQHEQHNGDAVVAVESYSRESSLLRDSAMEDEMYFDPALWPAQITESLRRNLVRRGPVQVVEYPFPRDATHRRFGRQHYWRTTPTGGRIWRSWLVYSKKRDAVYCFCCKLFSQLTKTVVSTGFRRWKGAAEMLRSHEQSRDHRLCVFQWKCLCMRLGVEVCVGDLVQLWLPSGSANTGGASSTSNRLRTASPALSSNQSLDDDTDCSGSDAREIMTTAAAARLKLPRRALSAQHE